MKSLIGFFIVILFLGPSLEAAPKMKVVTKLGQTSITEGIELKGTMTVTNMGSGELKILGVKPSCGCTTIKIPKRKLTSGESTIIPFFVDTRGKIGKVEKTIKIYSNSPGPAHVEPIAFHVLPKLKRGETSLNFILEPPCASCHIDPAVGKNGAMLFKAICKSCHVKALKTRSRPSLVKIISSGIPAMGMPAYQDYLDESQIQSLAEHIYQSH
ncbi:MAG: DUF1573 domain-containing protein [SAR324 cluster bacterium]|nr:DUF1573 domain-containing protein [SAR324 cluster bacterium]